MARTCMTHVRTESQGAQDLTGRWNVLFTCWFSRTHSSFDVGLADTAASLSARLLPIATNSATKNAVESIDSSICITLPMSCELCEIWALKMPTAAAFGGWRSQPIVEGDIHGGCKAFAIDLAKCCFAHLTNATCTRDEIKLAQDLTTEILTNDYVSTSL